MGNRISYVHHSSHQPPTLPLTSQDSLQVVASQSISFQPDGTTKEVWRFESRQTVLPRFPINVGTRVVITRQAADAWRPDHIPEPALLHAIIHTIEYCDGDWVVFCLKIVGDSTSAQMLVPYLSSDIPFATAGYHRLLSLVSSPPPALRTLRQIQEPSPEVRVATKRTTPSCPPRRVSQSSTTSPGKGKEALVETDGRPPPRSRWSDETRPATAISRNDIITSP